MAKLPGQEALGPPPEIANRGRVAHIDGSAIGRGIADLGRGISQAGANLAEAQARSDRFNAATQFVQFQADQQKSLVDQQNQAEPGAKDFTTGFVANYDKAATPFLEGLPASQRGEYGMRLMALKNNFREDATKFQINETHRFGQEQLTNGQNTILDGLNTDPEKWQQADQNAETLIKNAPDATPILNEERMAQWRATRGEAIVEARRQQLGPGAAAKGLVEEPSAAVPGSAASLIKSFEGFRATPYHDVNASRVGYGSDTITAPDGTVQRVKPGMVMTKADADRDLTRRVGDFQKGIIGKVGQDAWDKLNPNQQAALTSTAYNYGELPDRVVSAVKSGDAQEMSQAVARLGMDNNGINRERRAKEAALISGRETMLGTGATSDKGGSVAPEYAGIPFEKRVKLYDQLTNENRSLARSNLEQTVPDVMASIERSGSYNGAEPTQGDYQSAYGADEGAARYAAYEHARATAQTVNSFSTMSENDIAAKVAAADEAVPKGAGSAEAVNNLSTLQKAATQVLAAREKQPADYVVQNYPAVAQAWEHFNPADPGTARDAITQTIATQQALGIEPANIMPLPTGAVRAAAAQYGDQTKPIETRADGVTGTVLMSADPVEQRAIFNQLVKAGVPASAEAAVEAAARGDQPAARRLYAAATSNPEKLQIAGDKTAVEETKKSITNDINTALIAPGSIGEAYYGLQYGEPANYERAQRDVQLMESAARINLSQGMKETDAVARATQDLFGDVTRVNQVLPSGASVDVLLSTATANGLRGSLFSRTGVGKLFGVDSPIISGFEKMVPKVHDAVQAQADASMNALASRFPAASGQRAVLGATHKQHVQDIMNNGAFRSYGPGSQIGFFDTMSNTFVPGPDGKPLLFDLQDVVNAAPSTAKAGADRGRRQFTPPPAQPSVQPSAPQPGSLESLKPPAVVQ